MQHTNGCDNNFLRTPTKGGASAYNSSSNPTSAKSQPSTKPNRLDPIISLSSALPVSITSSSNQTKSKSLIKSNEQKDTYSFDLDDSDNFDVFKTKAGPVAKALVSPKDMYDFDLNESIETSLTEVKSPIILEQDLVSKRIRETILKSESKFVSRLYIECLNDFFY
jgi:hypothetical protein